jgi:hypothetical protein
VTHDSGPSTPAFRPRRRVLVAAVLATLLVAVLALWAAAGRRDLDPPLMITPALGAEASFSPTPAPLPSVTPSSSRATLKATRSKSPSPSPSSRRPSASPSARTTTPPPAFAADYVGGEERRGSFTAGVVLENEGRTARTWEVRIAYDADDRVRVERTFGARISASGSTLIFTGGPLAPGEDTMFGFRATTSADGQIRPTSCQVDGRACSISFR